ncbi:MAG: isoprenylcysteine carboxylmethyltransferase family protein [Eudoraea sp.]|nr:isoprenylcysteine carboxylmethyltransferase family protein [Eudoraea sp.]MBT8221757.1 isoprenylcysteine carboxylmethyltransferase family protein [Eudoraea sp.]
MELKVPPTVVFVCFGCLMWAVGMWLPFGAFEFFGRIWLIGALLIGAALIAGIALIQFFVSRTSIDPIHPMKTTKLVTTGVYQFSRNPMYLALLMILLAWGIWLGNAFNTLTAAGFVYFMNAYQIKPEEKYLLQLFGTEYKQYCTLVRRWF